MVVSVGLTRAAIGASSYPTIDRSCGIRTPISVAALIAAAAMLSLPAKMAVGRSALELLQWHWQLVQGDLEIPAAKRGKLLLLEDAVRAVAAEIDALC